MKLTHIHTLTARLELVTGLKIGGSNDTMRIGGVDNPIIRDPRTRLPYIPGSSLKGKLRSMLEWQLGLVGHEKSGGTYGLDEYKNDDKTRVNGKKLLQLFGFAPEKDALETAKDIGQGRLAFNDAFLCAEVVEKFNKTADGKPIAPSDLIEIKMETAINRITGTASDGLRTVERVSAGYAFDFKVHLKQFEGDADLLPTLLQGLKLLQLDSLGGSGSRGYGKVAFSHVKLGDKDITEQFKATNAFTA
jgi:CRISPR-associated protein Csm3